MNSTKTQVCTYFLKNACQRGASCHYSHQLPNGRKSSSSMACKYFQQGNCAFGDSCTKSHELKPRPKPPTSSRNGKNDNWNSGSSRTQSIQSDAPSCRVESNAFQADEVTEHCAEDDDTTSRAQKARSPCIFHSQGWKCDQGENCEFLHADSETVRAQTFNDNDNSRRERHQTTANHEVKSPSSGFSAAPTFVSTDRNPFPAIGDEQGDADLNQDGSSKEEEYESHRVHKDELPVSPSSDRFVSQGFTTSQPTISQNDQRALNGKQAIPLISYPHISEVIIHWSQYADPMADRSLPFCKLFAQGTCFQDALCRFRHSLTVDEYTLLFHDQQPNLWTSKRVNKVPAKKNVRRDDLQPSVSYSNIPEDIGLNPPEILSLSKACTFYPLGKCRNGDQCPYRHIGPPPAIPTDSFDKDWGIIAPSSHETVDKLRQPCKYFAQRGLCHMGDSCKFLHGTFPETQPEPVTEPWEDKKHSETVPEDDGWNTPWDAKEKNNDWTEPSTNGHIENVDNVDDTANEWNTPADTSGWFSYNNQTPTSTVYDNKKICFKFLEKKCYRGDSCKFSHDVESRNEGSSKGDPGWSNWDSDIKSDSPANPPLEDRFREQADSTLPGSNSPLENDDVGGSASHSEKPGDADDEDENAASWTQPWSDDLPSPGPKKYDAPCKAFGQGYCKYGTDCFYRHDPSPYAGERISNPGSPNEKAGSILIPAPESLESPNDISTLPSLSENPPERARSNSSRRSSVSNTHSGSGSKLEPIIFDHPIVMRPLMKCEVFFKQDVTPEKIKTSIDANTLTLSNMPVEVSPSDLTQLLGKYGKILDIVAVDESEDSTTIDVQFDEPSAALEAYRHINGQTYDSRITLASLNTQSPITLRFPNETLTVKISWPNPCIFVWSHYKTITEAKSEAARLNDVMFMGRLIKASFVSVKGQQKGPFPIKIEKLPINATKSDVENLCNGSVIVTMENPSYVEDPIPAIKTTLLEYGIYGFEILPGTEARAISVALVTFKSSVVVNAVVQSLHSQSQSFLGDQAMTARPVHYARYRIIRDQYEAVKTELDRLKADFDKKCTIQESEHPHDKSIMWIRIYTPFGSDPESPFSKANADLGQIIQGLVLKGSEQEDVWDDYFESTSGNKAFRQLNTNAFIHCDQRARKVRIFGSKQEQESAIKIVMKLLSKVRSQRLILDLPRSRIHSLLNGTLANIQAEIGINKVSLDVITSQITVCGNSEDISRAKAVLDLDSLPKETYAVTVDDTGMCQICLREPVDPLTLSCYHRYCTSCLQTSIRQMRHAPFQCVYQQPSSEDGETVRCQAAVPYAIIHDVLASEESDLLRSSLLAHVRRFSQEYFFCPSLNCQAVFRVGKEGINVRCCLCLSDICTFCKGFAHPSLPCS